MAQSLLKPNPRVAGSYLPRGATVYRVAALPGWIHPKTGAVRYGAFLRRQYPDGHSEPGVSVSESKQTAAVNLRQPHHGLIELSVSGVEDTCTASGLPRNLRVQADPVAKTDDGQHSDPSHALITGLPPYAPPDTGERQEAILAAKDLIRSAVIGFHPREGADSSGG